MKKLILLILLIPMIATAAPFLVCDAPLPEQEITYYNVYKDAVLEGTFDGEVLHYDLAGITPGAYNWTAEACNVWGCSLTSDPYISPSGAGQPLNTRMAL